MADSEKSFHRAIERSLQPKKYPKGYPTKAREIQITYDERFQKQRCRPTGHWEQAAQMATKLSVAMGDLEKPELRQRYEQAIEQFDMEE